jgi:predicted Zn-dependent protease
MNYFLKRALIFVLVMTVVAVACWGGRKAYKKSMEHHLIAQAHEYIGKKDWRDTTLCLQRVLQLDPFNVEGCRMIGDLLESQGSPAALAWRVRLAKLQTENMTNRLMWAETALKLQDFASAATALDGLNAATKQTAAYHKLAGALAWGLHQPTLAESEYGKALQLEPTNQIAAINYATVRLGSTNAATAQAARLSLEQLTSVPALRLVALRYLVLDAVGHDELTKAVAYSQEIIRDPAVTFDDKVKHLELLRAARSDEYTGWFSTLTQTCEHSQTDAYVLGNWIKKYQSSEVALKWLQNLPHAIQTNQPVPLLITECDIDLKRWSDLDAYLNQQSWGEVDFYRMAAESLALRSLGDTTAAQNAWQKSLLLAAHEPGRLTQLVQASTVWGWTAERTAVLQQIVDEFPLDKWAVEQLSLQCYADGDTAKLQDLLVRSQTADPSDIHIKNNLADVLMLRKSDLDKAYRLAKEAYDASAQDPFVVSTYAYSLMLQGKPDEASKLLDGVKPQYLQIPSVAAYYGVILAAAGHKDIARPYLDQANKGKLLPEELKMVQLARASL